MACEDLVADQAVNGGTDSTASDSSTAFDRMNIYGEITATYADSVIYGWETTENILLQLLVCDGDDTRANRGSLLSSTFTDIGIADGIH